VPVSLKRGPGGQGDVLMKCVKTRKKIAIPPNTVKRSPATLVMPVRRNTYVAFQPNNEVGVIHLPSVLASTHELISIISGRE
jgi:hypothetical protein